ncbi:hypothetical protein ElyMa_003773400 [Elysia marginata]|uniref:Uncharacterized protein n=1 Tax=Elysia marginata TaxID=1093978 RepID=A0AAV4F9S1_9GAST|nr:hypothetical protein ElyMa_003773400 [Elysia marginata]
MTNVAYNDPTPTDTILTAQSWFQNFNKFPRTDTRLTTYRLTSTMDHNASVLKVQEKTGQTSTSREPLQSSTNAGLPTNSNRNSQKLLLQGAIKRKSTDSNLDDSTESKKTQKSPSLQEENTERPDAKLMAGIPGNNGTTMVVAGILPGIADYADDDSSTENESNSSDSEADHMIAPSVITRRVVQEMMQKLKNDGDEGGCG